MEITEIMVGDWVEVIQNSEKHYAQVQMIDGYGDNATSDECICDAVYYSIDELNPIPLTEQILKKNGFKDGIFNVSPQYYLEDNDVFIGVTLKDIPDKYKGFNIAKGKLYLQYDISYRKEPIYVHELQRALRLCKSNKKIEL